MGLGISGVGGGLAGDGSDLGVTGTGEGLGLGISGVGGGLAGDGSDLGVTGTGEGLALDLAMAGEVILTAPMPAREDRSETEPSASLS